MRVIAFVALVLSGAAAAQTPPPVQPVVPQPISFAEMERHDLFGVGCAFLPRPGGKDDMIALSDDVRGVIKLNGTLVRLAVDRRSAVMPYGTHARYAGSGYVLRFAKTARRPTSVGTESEDWPATMTISDSRGRRLFATAGTLNCGA